MPKARVRIGISGWRYKPWRGSFYPAGLAQSRELAYAAAKLPTIEINGSFYSLQRPSSYAAWHEQTPADFVFALKGPRYITHMLKLKNVESPLANFLASGLFRLREKLGPLLWQFPPQLRFDRDRMRAFLELLPRSTGAAARLARKRDAFMRGRTALAVDTDRRLRHAMEVRHESFADEAFLDLLREHGVALVIAETAGRWPLLEDITADFVYMRLHGDKKLYASGYSDKALDRWAGRIRAWHQGSGTGRGRDVFCYFDNTDVKLRAPFDAQSLIRKLGS